MAVDTSGPATCQPYAATSAFNYAGDSQTGNDLDRVQCSEVRYYPVQPPFRGTAPYSISLVPLHGTPVTVNIPSSATRNESYFVYNSRIPFAAGTQFYQFLSDATGGGSGGGSSIYTVAPSDDSSCIGDSLSNQDSSHALPTGQYTASFQNMAGAVDSGSGSSDGDGSKSNVGGLVGGIIGAVIGVCGILLLVGAYIIYRRRQRRKAELERKEQPQFIDLDDDDDVHRGAPAGAMANMDGSLGSGRGGRTGSFAVSPFTYQAAPHESPTGLSNEVMMLHNGSNFSPHGTNAGAGDAAGDGRNNTYDSDSPGLRYPPAAGIGQQYSQSNPLLAPPGTGTSSGGRRPSAGHVAGDLSRRGSNAPTDSELVSVYSGGGGAGHRYRPASIQSGSGSGSGPAGTPGSPGLTATSGRYVLRARNDEANTRQAPALPQKTKMYPGADDDEDGSRAAAHVMQHTDGGPVGQSGPASGVEELPPSYGQWNQRSGARPPSMD